jgi:glutamate-ammonia-ligase adenylyltransferase
VTTPYDRLLAQVVSGPDPEGAPARLAHFFEAASAAGGLEVYVPDEMAERLLCVLLGQSPALGRTLIQEPAWLTALARDPYLEREKPGALMRTEAENAIARAGELSAGLRRYCRREMLRLGARELGWGAAEEVGRELAHLAEACLDAALASLWPALEARLGVPRREDGERCRFVVFGLGKLGGEELNFSSDIDLLYVYETDAGQVEWPSAAGPACSLHEWFTALATRLGRAIEEMTAEGSCFRVDLRLRPEGTRGPLVNALPALERYYETWGRAWERQAWIKARPVTGDRTLGDEVLRMLGPFVWPRSSFAGGPVAVAAVREMVRLLRQARAASAGDDDVKLGRGGIREVEFLVQALQLIHGGQKPALRERGTLRALDQLLFAGLVSDQEHRVLGDAYLVLRRVEHRVQLEELRQTHTLPREPQRRALLARRLGHATAAMLDQWLGAQRQAVAEIFATLNEEDAAVRAETGRSSPARQAAVDALLDPECAPERRAGALRTLGFRQIDASLDEMELLLGKPRSPFAASARDAARRTAADLLGEIASCPDPDLALRRMVDLVARGGAAASVWRLVEAHPPVGRLLVSLFGTSDFLAKRFLAHPDLVEPLLASPRIISWPWQRGDLAGPRAAHERALAERLAALPAEAEDELRLEAVRRYRNEELLRIGLADIAGELEVEEVSAELSLLAEVCLGATFRVVTPAVNRRAGLDPEQAPALAVIGLGKLGSGEMSYSSDLDLLFVFDAEVATGRFEPFEFHSRLAQRLIRGLEVYLREGRLYEVDTRLRPSGQKGALVSSLLGFRQYHQGAAALWERQALIRARAVAGDAALGQAVEAIMAGVVWARDPTDPMDPAQVALEIGRLRTRMERELAQEAPERGRYHIKAGRGGLVDVEFLVQYLQLVEGPGRQALRVRAIRPALDALRAAGLLTPGEHEALVGAYLFLRRLENRLRIVHDRSIAELPGAAPEELDKLARRLGYRGAACGARLLDEYRDHTARVRIIYQKYLPAEALPTAAE